MNVLEAVARMEGFYVPGSRPNRNNNPGDIEYGAFAKAHAATGTDGRFAKFPDSDTGFTAMRALFLEHYKGMTVERAITKWAPPPENDTTNYIRLVCFWTKSKPTDVIDTLL